MNLYTNRTGQRSLKAAFLAMALTGAASCQGADFNRATVIEIDRASDCAANAEITVGEIKNLIGGTVQAEAVDAFVTNRMDALNIPGVSVAIINDGRVVYLRSMGIADVNSGDEVTACSIFQGASITKPLFGYFVMSFVEEGKLDLDRPLYEYLPYADIAHDERYKTITARMALTHQSGFPNWRTDFDDKQLFIQFEPGTDYSYSGEGYQYLSLVLQEIAGVDHAGLEALFQERVAKPLGMTHTQIIPSDTLLERTVSPHVDGAKAQVRSDNSYQDFGAAYGVHSEAGDFSKWLIALMNEEGLSKEAFDAYFEPQSVPVPKDENPIILAQDYGLGFAIIDTPLGRLYSHNGNNPGFSSLITLQRDQRWGVVVFSNANQTSDLGTDLILFLNTP